MSKLLVATVTLLASALLGCAASDTTCIPAGTSIAVARANGSGTCAAAVVAGVTALNGTETFSPMKALACGVTHFNLNVTFFSQDATHQMCQGSDAISFEDLGSGGGSGSDTLTVTCADGTTCTATFDVTFTAP